VKRDVRIVCPRHNRLIVKFIQSACVATKQGTKEQRGNALPLSPLAQCKPFGHPAQFLNCQGISNDPTVISPISKSAVLSAALTSNPPAGSCPANVTADTSNIRRLYQVHRGRMERKDDDDNSERGRVTVNVQATL
jgi:hypothetical protein